MSRRYRLHCEYCSYNRYTDGTDIGDLVPYKRSPIQTTIPKLDPKTGKTMMYGDGDDKKASRFINLPKQFKCPGCGRLIRPRRLADSPEDKKNDQNLPGGSQGGDAGWQI